MLRSMYSGISGLKNFQTKLDVIGNNIANVNTYGFKKGRVTFKDAISQTTMGASASTDTRGGTNAVQIGLGSSISSIDTIDTAGSLQNTSRTLDLGIQGDGYFIVNDGTNDYYTRAGNFYLDEKGTLVTGEGYKVENTAGNAIQMDIDNIQSFSISQNGAINVVKTDGTSEELAIIALAKFSNPGGLEKAGGNLLKESVNSGQPLVGASSTDGRGTISSGTLEMSNVDLSEEFTDMIVAQRGFQANTRIITTSDEILQELVNLKR